MMSIYFNTNPVFYVLLGLLLTTVLARAELEASSSNNDGKIQTTKRVVIRKCCKENEILVETNIGIRSCKLRSDYIEEYKESPNWEPQFYSFPHLKPIPGPQYYETEVGVPQCSGPGEYPHRLHETDPRKSDSFRLLANGSLSFKGDIRDFHNDRADLLKTYISGNDNRGGISENTTKEDVIKEKTCPTEEEKSDRVLYSPEKYCVDQMVLDYKHLNKSSPLALTANEIIIEFAVICVHHEVDMVRKYLYPGCLSISILCLIVTFLLYSVLPQLRDLTGKFILGICGCSVSAFALKLIDIFGAADQNVHNLTTEFLLHTSVVCLWLSLNCMGHHVWQIIRSKSVFTRVSDGKRLRYYSVYILLLSGSILVTAAVVHFFIEIQESENPCENNEAENNLGWKTLSVFYGPVVIILLVNIYFYWASQRTMSKQLLYNRNMQHFQVNFDLYTKFLVIVGIWWLFHSLSLLLVFTIPTSFHALDHMAMVFNVLHGPLVFLVAMCRTRVSFLFKRYFCINQCWCCCCKGGDAFAEQEFIEEECQELATIDMLKERCEQSSDPMPETKRLTNGILNGTLGRSVDVDKELSMSLFNVKCKREPGEVQPPADPDAPIGRVRRLLKSNSLTALANINFGWRKETSV